MTAGAVVGAAAAEQAVVATLASQLIVPGVAEEGVGASSAKDEITAAGNPMRFTSGTTAIRADDEWQAAMAPSSRRLVTALTLPVLATSARSTI